MGIRFGAEYEILPGISLKADAGSTIFSLEGAFALTYDLFAVYRLTDKKQPFQADILVGLPYNMWVPAAGAAMFAPGVSADVGWQFNETVALYLRAGGGYPIFFTGGNWTFGTKNWPVWPDAALELKYSL